MSKRPFMLLNLMIIVLLFAQSGFAQSPLQYFKNYFLWGGDYVVGGWVKGAPTTISGLPYATGTISIPDNYPATLGFPAGAPLPSGAEIVAAFLYWQTIEGAQTSFAGNTAYIAAAKDANGTPIVNPTLYQITGTDLDVSTPVSWSSGGCGGSSGGSKVIRTYRADVLRFLNVDQNSGLLAGTGTYTVNLADSGSTGNTSPIALGATLVLVFRGPSSATLNAVVIYDGSYAPNNPAVVTTQVIQGFYQPSTSANQLPNAKLTYIVGSGQTNKYQSVSLQTVTTDGVQHSSVPLPSTYGANAPAFIGLYNGSWDNPTWFPNQSGKAVLGFQNVVSSANTVVTPRANNKGCVSSGAIIFKTDVQDTDGDGLVDVWETNSGLLGPDGNPLPDIHAMGANPNVRDLFVDVDYMYLTAAFGGVSPHSHLPSKAVLDKVGDAFKNAPTACFNGVCKGIAVHFDIGNNYQSAASPDPYIIQSSQATLKGGNPILETACDPASPDCLFPNFAGTLGWKLPFLRIKNGDPTASPPLPASFDHSRKDMFHYALFAHTIALPRFMTLDGTLVDVSVSSGEATVTTAVPHGLSSGDFVTISGAPVSANINGVYKVDTVNTVPPPYSFTISIPGAPNGTYSNGGLGVGNGVPRSVSGVGDRKGGDVIITLGRWDNFVGSDFVQASTLMHELGHNQGLGHAGDLSDPINCKTNYQSIMSYLYQVPGLLDKAGIPHIDYSNQVLPPLAESENELSEITGLGESPLPYRPAWYALVTSPIATLLGVSPATLHCDGTPILDSAQMVRVQGDATSLTTGQIDWNWDGTIEALPLGFKQDVNFDGKITGAPGFKGFNDWSNIEPNQVGSRSSGFVFSLDVWLNDDTGDAALTSTPTWAFVLSDWSDPAILGGNFGGPAGSWGGPAGSWGGPAGSWGGPAGSWGGPAGSWGGPAGSWGAAGEQDVETASANGNAPSGLTATPSKPPVKNIDVKWSPPNLGLVQYYDVWRGTCPTTTGVVCSIANSSPTIIFPGLSPAGQNCDGGFMFCDTTTVKGVVYLYFVEAQILFPDNVSRHSGPSNQAQASR